MNLNISAPRVMATLMRERSRAMNSTCLAGMFQKVSHYWLPAVVSWSIVRGHSAHRHTGSGLEAPTGTHITCTHTPKYPGTSPDRSGLRRRIRTEPERLPTGAVAIGLLRIGPSHDSTDGPHGREATQPYEEECP